MTSDQIIELARHDNIVGVKLTCGNTGKLARVASATRGTGFLTMGGSSDFLLQTLAVGGHGIIAGLGNLAPRTNVQAMLAYETGKLEKARELQVVLADADWVAIKGGFVAVKVGLNRFHGYGGLPRLPCALPEGKTLLEIENGFGKLMEVESSFEKQN